MELVGKDEGARTKNKRLFVCPYHAWSYGTNGELMNVPFGEEGFGNCDAVHVENRNLIALPAAERGGVLLVITSPANPDQDHTAAFEEAIPPEMVKELDLFGLSKHYRVAEQTFRVGGNWKFILDGFGEQYHLGPLHPTSASQVNVCNLSDFRRLGPHGVHTVGAFTTRIMAAGDVEESRWDEPSLLNHCTPFYSLCPNQVLLVTAQNLVSCQGWPGEHPGECYATVTLLKHTFPSTEAEKLVLKRAFKFLLDLFATEDFAVLPKIQNNFQQNPHAEAVYGRSELVCQEWYKYFETRLAASP